MSVRLKSVVRFAVMTAGVVLTAAPAFAWYGGGGGGGGGGCWGACGGGMSVPEPSTLALLGVAIPGAAAWVKHKLF